MTVQARPETAEQPRRGRRTFAVFALISGLIGLLFASPIGVMLYVMGMISVIGVPVAFVVELIPTIAFVIVAAYFIWRFVPGVRRLGILVAFPLAASLLTIIPLLHNLEMRSVVAGLTSENVGSLSSPPDLASQTSRTVGFAAHGSRAAYCDALCVHMLITGQARQVMMIGLKRDEADIDLDAEAYLYSRARGGVCQQMSPRSNRVRLSSRQSDIDDPQTIAGRFAGLTAQGQCIVAEQAPVSSADTIVVFVGESDFSEPWTLSPIASKLSARRAVIYARTDAQRHAVIWRQTEVDYSLLREVLLLKVHIPAGLAGARNRLWRQTFEGTQTLPSRPGDFARQIGFRIPEKLY